MHASLTLPSESSMPRLFSASIIMFISFVCVLCLLLNWGLSSSSQPHVPHSSEPYEASDSSADLHYALIVDAGSSGSRIFGYCWPNHSGDTRQLLQIRPLLDELLKPVVRKISPGLSSFAENPENATTYIKPVIDYAASKIPPGKHRQTTLFIFATAGLRLLPEKQSTAILDDLRTELPKLYSFIIIRDNIAMISGEWEGLFSWIAINYALGRFDHSTIDPHLPAINVFDAQNSSIARKPTVGMVDMGGGSVQIAFEARSSVPEGEESLVVDLNLGCREHDAEHLYRVYVATFLGFGANSAQLRYEALLKAELSTTVAPTGMVQTDPCIQPGRLRNLLAASKVPSIVDAGNASVAVPVAAGVLKGTGIFDDCRATLSRLLLRRTSSECKAQQRRPCSFDASEYRPPRIDFSLDAFYGFSELWYTSNDVLQLSGSYNFTAFRQEAAKFCATRWEKLWRWFQGKLFPKADKERMRDQCFKSAWLSTVLHDGFGFPTVETAEKKESSAGKLVISSTINGQEVQWTLGAILYHMRFFPRLEIEKKSLHEQHVRQNGGVATSSRWLPSRTLSLLLLGGCFLVVLVFGVRYLVVLRRWRRTTRGAGASLNGWASTENKRTNGGGGLQAIGALPARVRRFGSSLALVAPTLGRARNAYSYSLLVEAEKGGYIH